MNELDKLRKMLDEAKIPYENHVEEWNKHVVVEGFLDNAKSMYGDVGKYSRNQVIYGRRDKGWKFDAICQYGSYGAKCGFVETYGELGVDKDGQPRILNAQEAFDIIYEDWMESR